MATFVPAFINLSSLLDRLPAEPSQPLQDPLPTRHRNDLRRVLHRMGALLQLRQPVQTGRVDLQPWDSVESAANCGTRDCSEEFPLLRGTADVVQRRVVEEAHDLIAGRAASANHVALAASKPTKPVEAHQARLAG